MKNLFTILAAFLVFDLSAQNLKTPTLSPFTEIKQEVGLTEISLSYARPSAKGRQVFGNLVPFDKIWRTGANASTKISFEEDVKVGGQPLSAGTYAIYTIPGQTEWTIIIHNKTNMRSIAGDKVLPENDAFRFNVIPKRIQSQVETFTMQFADLRTNSCNLRMTWEKTAVDIPIEVEVATKIESQMSKLMQDDAEVPHRTYFLAAEYFLHNKKDLDQAIDWIEAALQKSPKNARYGLLKSKIQNDKGQHDLAVETVKEANVWARSTNNTNYTEQTELYLAGLLGKGSEKPAPNSALYMADVKDLDHIINALYASISGEKGEKRDWNRFKNLFVDEARLIPSGKNREGKMGYRIMSPEEYVQGSGPWLEENGFFEIEIEREEARYGSLIHVFSTYESYRSKSDDKPFARGINSIQLVDQGDKLQIMQIYWLGETEEAPIPSRYLPKK